MYIFEAVSQRKIHRVVEMGAFLSSPVVAGGRYVPEEFHDVLRDMENVRRPAGL